MAFQFADFLQWLPQEYDFDRMENYNDDYTDMNYEKFVEWNKECFNSASDEKREFLSQICKNIMGGQMSLMDMESCVEFQAYGIYFNAKKVICIYNQR